MGFQVTKLWLETKKNEEKKNTTTKNVNKEDKWKALLSKRPNDATGSAMSKWFMDAIAVASLPDTENVSAISMLGSRKEGFSTLGDAISILGS
mgnify:CR=1 FL=1